MQARKAQRDLLASKDRKEILVSKAYKESKDL
jgi:hypothetical protein